MQHASPVPADDAGLVEFVQNLSAKLSPALATSLNVPAADVTILTQINTMLTFAWPMLEQVQQRTKDINAFWRWFLRGPVDPAGPQTQTFPAALAWTPPATAVIGNARSWLGRFATRLKGQPNCTPAIRADLGLDGAPIAPPDPQTWKPVLACSFTAGHPVIEWPRQGKARLEIHVDRGQGWGILDIDDLPDYMDLHALPAPGSAVV